MNGIGPAGPLGHSVDRSAASRASEREHWIALSLLPGIGPATFWRLIERHGTAAAAWRDGLTDAAGPATLRREDPRAIARRVEAATASVGGRIVTALDETYPPALLTLDPRPATLHVVGSDEAFALRAVAIVGTRGASGYGHSVAAEIAGDLGEAGVVVVSGLALGIDGTAHRAALESGGRTVAVLPSPLDRVYPPRHRELARRIVARGGALVTEISVGSQVGKPDFARRNRVIAGLAEAVVVVEAPDRSGALLTAAAAIAIGRELYAVPGPITAMASRGCNRLIADRQASIVTSSASLLREIGLANRGRAPVARALSEVEGQVLTRLLERSGSLEELVDRTRHQPSSVASALSLLEARGLVSAFGGATFHPTLAARRLTKVV
jgi:DNA processing protein